MTSSVFAGDYTQSRAGDNGIVDYEQKNNSFEKTLLRNYHAPRWDEPLIFELSAPGHTGILPESIHSEESASDTTSPEHRVRREDTPRLPEIGQAQILRHYMRLSQETLGADLNVDIGQGTCTMKYSPKVNEKFAGSPSSVDLHPLQNVSTVQGTMEILYNLQNYLKEISGMAEVSLQAGSGSAAIYGAVKSVQAFHTHSGESQQRDEIITTIFSHPSNAATAKTAGYKVITLYPDENGYPDIDALKAVLSERTAALFITNPEDTGIFNPDITDFVDAVHEVGGICFYDQANANGLLGIARARDAGFDMCHFNLHKTFSTPHACGGPAAGALCASEEMAPFLPGRTVVRNSAGFDWSQPTDNATADIRPFYGVIPNLIRAYAWIRALGAEGLRQVAEIAVLNSNYLHAKLSEVDGVSVPYAEGEYRIEQVRYSWQDLANQTGISTGELGARMADFGFHYWTSHHPYIVPEPMTLEPTESYSKRELDEYITSLRYIADEARRAIEIVKTAPHRSSIHTIDVEATTDPETWVTSWRAYRKKYLGEKRQEPDRWRAPSDLPVPERAPKAHHR